MRLRALIEGLLVVLAGSGCSFALNPANLPVSTVSLGSSVISVSPDTLHYDFGLKKLIVGGDNAGNLVVYDPESSSVHLVAVTGQGSSTSTTPGKITSAIVAHNFIYAIDSASKTLFTIDPASGTVLGSVPVKSTPEYVRFATAKNELWVTEPGDEQIEVFALGSDEAATPIPSDVIHVPDGPVGLTVDNGRGLAYTNQPTSGRTAVIQVQTHGIIGEWGNGCSEGRGMALDTEHAMLFIACREGKVVMLDTNQDGKQVTSQNYGGDLEEVAYNPRLHHLYLPSGASSILAIFGVEVSTAPQGTQTDNGTPAPETSATKIQLARLGTADTTLNAKCAATDNDQYVWVCDPSKSQLFMIKDTFPASSQDW